MVNCMVDRATSDLLMGPDWAVNVEIADMLNHDPGQARSVFKGIKKRLGSKNPKVQLLTLTLLETLVHSCGGDIVHIHIADRDIIHDMVKIVKKKQPDFLVKEKILSLIDTWQKAFGGLGPRYSQYYAAHQELAQYGAVFRAESSTPIFTPPQQIQPFLTHPTNRHGNTDNQQQEADFPTLSSTEIENARGVMNVLSEMLNVIDPENKEGIKEEVIVDLVEQCRNYKQSILHLVSSTTDEALLHQGLALNDDLQRVLAKHEGIASGPPEDAKPDSHGSLIDIDTGDNNKDDQQCDRSASTAGTSTTMDPKIDLLSFDDDFTNSTKTEPSNALVPVGDQQPAAAATPNDQNALALLDMFSDTTNPPPHTANADGGNLHDQSDPCQQHTVETASPELATTTGAHGPGPSSFDQPYYTQNNPAWNSHTAPQQPPSPNSTSLPPPPWEVPSGSSQGISTTQNPQEMHAPGAILPQAPHKPWSEQQPPNMYMMPQQQVGPGPQYSPQPNQMMQGGAYMMAPGGQVPYMYVQPVYGGQPAGAYGYGQAGGQYADQRVQGLMVKDDSGIGSTTQQVPPSYLPPMRASKPEDKLFGDLVDMAKVKPSTPSRGRFSSM